jgi:Ackermannviridae homing endonuclease
MEIKEFFKQKDPSGKYKNEKYIKNNYIDYYNIIINFSKEYNLEDLPFKQKVYHYVYDKKNHILCECGKKVNFKNFTIGYLKYCSNKCVGNSDIIKKKKEINSLKKYGTKTPSESKIIKDKIIKTNQERYGSNSPLQNEKIQKKSKETLMKNYGVDHPLQNEEIQKKRISNFDVEKWKKKKDKTMMKLYGNVNALSIDKFKEKAKQTNIERYDVEFPLQNKEIKEKMLNTVKNKYGVDCVLKVDEIKEKAKQTNIERYGVDNVFKLKEVQNNICKLFNKKYGGRPLNNVKIKEKMLETLKITYKNKILSSYENIINYDFDNKVFTFECEKCGKFEIKHTLLHNRTQSKTIICTKCNPINQQTSGLEIQLLEFIKNNYSGIILSSIRTIINPLELDIYLPNLNLAFEFNGLYWHNELNKSDDYHLNKTELCEKQGIQLIHIWEDDWLYKQDIVKSMIFNKLKLNKERIYARKCEVQEINDNGLIRNFLNENHIQGFVGSKVKIGLFYNDKLVSLMTFGKGRKNMNSKSEWELLRFCNTKYTNVIGGASRLFKYFIRNYNPNEIITFADRSHSNGNLYEQLKFNFIHKTQPNYHYIVNGIREYRFKYRKDILVKEGYDKNKSEHNIMLERNIYRIYNSGNLKYEYKKIKNLLN